MSAERCSVIVYRAGAWNGHPCSRAGTVEREGKWYCGQHDPEAKRALEAKREAEMRARRRLVMAQDALVYAIREAGAALENYVGELPPVLDKHRVAIKNARAAVRGGDA